VHWDKQTFDRLLSRPPEPLQSRFVVNHGMLLDLLGAEVPERGGGYGRLVKLIRRSHQRDHGKRGLLKTAARGFRTLWHAQLISVEKGRPAKVSVSSELQRDFSLLHTLSLYLLVALQKLDPQSENYALDVITLTESILENPDVVLYAQLNQLKADKVAEMKAQGVEYEQRMEELEKLEWPKPHRDFIYATFNDFADKHPWVGQENIRPKSIARDMLERFLSFHDYIREYGLARSEGVLLRYLSDVYKALSQNVPETYLNEELEGFIAQLRLLLKQVDSSLLDEWEALSNPQEWVTLPGEKLSAAPKKWWEDDKQVVARARASAHALLKALGEKRYEDARLMVRPGDVEWTAEKLEAEMAPYWAEYSAVVLTPVARRPHNTVFRTEGPKRWKVQQKVMDPEANGEWMLDCILDLSQPPEEDAPLLELRRIGT
jgi:superfamily II RNA helicase